MKKQITITIGIPAYNEGRNIKSLLSSLLSQKMSGYNLEKIIVFSDGSTDNTVQAAKSLKNNRIGVVANKKRQGLAAGLNYLVQASRSDVLVILNADITVRDRSFIEKLVQPFKTKNVDLVSAKMVELPATNFFSSAINASMQFKTVIYEKLNHRDNVYLCHGQVRAFSKKFYKTLHFPYSVAEDAYSYFFCKKQKRAFYYNADAVAYYKVPNNINEHKNQSDRFFVSPKLLQSQFGKKYLEKQYKIPSRILMNEFALFFFLKPVECIYYVGIMLYLKLKAQQAQNFEQKWEISISSKSVSI